MIGSVSTEENRIHWCCISGNGDLRQWQSRLQSLYRQLDHARGCWGAVPVHSRCGGGYLHQSGGLHQSFGHGSFHPRGRSFGSRRDFRSQWHFLSWCRRRFYSQRRWAAGGISRATSGRRLWSRRRRRTLPARQLRSKLRGRAIGETGGELATKTFPSPTRVSETVLR